MTTQVAAGALSHADLGKVVLTGWSRTPRILATVQHTKTRAHLILSTSGGILNEDVDELSLDPHTLVTIKEADRG